MASMEPMGLREFGRWLGKTGEAVRKAIATGKIPRDCIGETTLSSGRTRPVITDPERARKHWGQNVQEHQVRDRETLSRGRAAAHARARGEEPATPPPPAPATAGEGAGLNAGGKVPTITESNAIKAAYDARLKKLEYDEKSGKVVNAEQVKVRVVQMITTARTKVLGVPTKAKARLPHLTVQDIETLEELLAEALEELAHGS